MPKLWSETVDAHRREVRDAILDTAASLASQRGVLALTMSEIAGETGIGRATLYKYFDDVEAILLAWHERHVREHLDQLVAVARGSGSARDRLGAVLERYALILHERGHSDHSAALHRDEHTPQAEQHLHSLFRDLLEEGAEAGDLRDDIPAEELAAFCLHALSGAGSLPSKASLRRLVAVTCDALAPGRA